MKTKLCQRCGKPFNVIETGDRPEDLDQGKTYLAAAADTCLSCHRESGTAPDLTAKVVRAAAPTKAERLARYGRDHSL